MVSFTQFITAGLLATSAFAAPVDRVQKRGSPKRGAAYNDASLVSALTGGGAVSWAYDWNLNPDGELPPGVPFIPMLWGQKMLDGWSSAAETALTSGSQFIFGFNEPDISSQANLSPADAANLFRENLTPYGDRATLATPAVSNGNSPGMGLDWMNSFLQTCGDCKASIMAIHWYGDSVDDFTNHVNQAIDMANNYGLQSVWVTEFALNDASQAVPFLNAVLPWLDSNEHVGGYAYYYDADGYLLEGTGLSASGQIYAS